MFPFLYVPSMGPFEALFYLPTAFLFDLGAVTLILYLITQSKKDVKLPWPKFSVDIDEVKPSSRTIGRIIGLIAMTALTSAALYLYIRYGTIFFVNFNLPQRRPIFTPGAGQWFSLILIGLWGISAISLAIKLVASSPWVDAVEKALSLVLIGLAFRQPFETAFAIPLSENLIRTIKLGLTITLLIICIFVASDFIKAVIRIGRKRLAKNMN
jgi:hypothetical protein